MARLGFEESLMGCAVGSCLSRKTYSSLWVWVGCGGKMGGRSRAWSGVGVNGKAPGMRSDGVVGCEESGFVVRSAGE